MALKIPKYIELTGIVDTPITHDWDNANPLKAYYCEDSRLEHRIAGTSDRGVIALSAGFAEWVAWRMQKHVADPVLFQLIEAIWASIVDWRYIRPFGLLKREEWNGPLGGPIWAAANLLRKVKKLISGNEFAWPEAVCLSYLVLHVIPDPKPFKDWRRFAIRRLVATYPQNKDDLLGEPVPREITDPDFEYKPEMAKDLLGSFLEKIDPSENPYLSAPKEMLEAGFKGTPYSL